ncbi:hypothetical protein AB0K67_12640 [Nonomuraea sp. NPDC052634]|uniref:hypothetical protein n=1 Tax=Nonomuraea sp. NPDC052634 TaxID=3155813 RepID=UPI00341696F3
MRSGGVLVLPVTPFGPDGGLAESVLARHVADGVAAGAGGVFAACGTGALTPASTSGSSPPPPRDASPSSPEPTACCAPRVPWPAPPPPAGADGLLLMPPYLVTGPATGPKLTTT